MAPSEGIKRIPIKLAIVSGLPREPGIAGGWVPQLRLDIQMVRCEIYRSVEIRYHAGMEANPVMRKTSVEIDDRLITQARRVLGTSSIKETIDSALREIVRAEARRQEVQALSATDELDLANENVMAKAWRS